MIKFFLSYPFQRAYGQHLNSLRLYLGFEQCSKCTRRVDGWRRLFFWRRVHNWRCRNKFSYLLNELRSGRLREKSIMEEQSGHPCGHPCGHF